MGDEHQVPVAAQPPLQFHFQYTVQKGYFQQSEDSTDDKKFDFVSIRLSMISTMESQLRITIEEKQLRPHR